MQLPAPLQVVLTLLDVLKCATMVCRLCEQQQGLQLSCLMIKRVT